MQNTDGPGGYEDAAVMLLMMLLKLVLDSLLSSAARVMCDAQSLTQLNIRAATPL